MIAVRPMVTASDIEALPVWARRMGWRPYVDPSTGEARGGALFHLTANGNPSGRMYTAARLYRRDCGEWVAEVHDSGGMPIYRGTGASPGVAWVAVNRARLRAWAGRSDDADAVAVAMLTMAGWAA